MSFEWPKGATPLTTEETQGLIPTWVVRRSDLDAVEQANILSAQRRLARRRKYDVLNDDALCDLHRMMFGDVWRWAGEFRLTNKNIGVDYVAIRVALRELLNDTCTWIDTSAYDWVELGARFHHRLVKTHCFANGNGRHSRLATDLLLRTNGQAQFNWGEAAGLSAESGIRARYIAALQAADDEDYGLLLKFVTNA